MADKKITQLNNITGANLVDADEFVVVDISADETKAITLGELKEAFDAGSGFVRVTGDTMTGALTTTGLTVDGGSTSTIRITGQGQGSNEFSILEFFNTDGSNDGPQVTGKISMTGNASGVNSSLNLYTAKSDTGVEGAAPTKRMTIAANGDISFYEDTGTTAKFFWDASAESLGIGTTSFPNAQNKLTIQGNAGASGSAANTSADEFFIDNNGDTGMTLGSSATGTAYLAFADPDVALRGGLFYDHSTDDMGFRVASQGRMTLDSSGNLDVTGSVNVGNDLNITGPSPIIKLTDNDTADEYTLIQNLGGATFIDGRNGTVNGQIIFRGQGGGTNEEYGRFISNGNFGIGENVPAAPLHVNGGTTNTVARFHSEDSGASLYLTDSTTTGGEAAAHGLITTGDNLEVRGLGKVVLATGTTDKVTVLSDGKVGIGDTNPTHELSVVSAGDTTVEIKSTGTGDADALLILDSAAEGESEIQFFHDGVLGANIQWFTDGNPDLNIATAVGTNGVIDFQPNNTNAMRIQSDGNVRIGGNVISATITGLTQTNLVVGSLTGGEIVAYRNDNALAEGDFVGAFLFGNDDNTATEDHFAGMWATAHGTGGSVDVKFAAQKGLYEAGTPQMLLRSEGDLLVGTTSITNYNNNAGTEADNGFLYLDSGVLSVSSYKANANVGFVQYLNRTDTDGGFLDFRKDGVSVGVVGVASSNNLYIGATAADHAGVYFGTNIVYPMTAGSISNGFVDLGSGTSRFKNLHLSGGVVFDDAGGVGPSISNTLDSYETGTFTMGATFSTTAPTAGPKQATGYYVKTGNSCTIWLTVSNINVTGGAGDLRLNNSGGSNGLPFVSRGVGVTGLGSYMGSATISNCNVASTTTQINAQQLDGVNYIRFTEQIDSASTDVINVANCEHGATDISLCMTYPVA